MDISFPRLQVIRGTPVHKDTSTNPKGMSEFGGTAGAAVGAIADPAPLPLGSQYLPHDSELPDFKEKTEQSIMNLTVETSTPKHRTITPTPLICDISSVYNDEFLTIFCKPQGLSTMGGSPSLHRSDALLLPKNEITTSKYKKCVPIHRLDKSTGGLVVCSKNLASEKYLKELLRRKEMKKRYIALVVGYVEISEGIITSIIDGADAISEYSVISRTKSASYEWITTINLWPITGKQHQLRRHMKHIGHPILGDKRYWNTRDTSRPILQSLEYIPSKLQQCYLWAVEVSFLHPSGSGELLTVSIDEPVIYQELRELEKISVACSVREDKDQDSMLLNRM